MTASVLPSGLVAFLLTDVVGSTKAWEERPADTALAMERHDRLIADAVTAAGGTLLKSRGEGDATFSVFSKASQAARAAAAAQRALTEQELRVRMAIHVGEAVERGGDYYGPTVNRAARLRSIAEGGEVLLSRSAAELVLDEPGEPLPLVQVGVRQLKDLSRPETVYRLGLGGPEIAADTDTQVELGPVDHVLLDVPGGRGTRDVIGREEELAALHQLVESARLVTVHGVGGCGKTTLVREFVRRTPPEALVDVALVTSPSGESVEAALARALGLAPAPGSDPLDAVVEALSTTCGLLVVDNCEHVADGVRRALARILESCAGWSVVTTSRVVLGLTEEHVLALAPLAVPPVAVAGLYELLRVPSVQLFEERARRRATSFAVNDTNADAVARICRRLDGLPLAVELAAAWVPVLSPSAIAEQLDEDLLALVPATRAREERHRTLDRCIAWSLGLLPADELELLQRLAVFDGSVELGTAAQLTSGDARSLLAGLVAGSLVVVEESSGRFGLLETVREGVRRSVAVHAQETLHNIHFQAVRLQALARVDGGRCMPTIDGQEAASAVAWAASQDRVDDALELIGLLEDLWWRRPDGKALVDRVLAMEGGSRLPRVGALLARAIAAVTTLDYATAVSDCREALEIALEAADRPLEGRARRWLGWTLSQLDPAAAREELETARRLLADGPDVQALADSICGLAALAATDGDPVSARRHLDEMSVLTGSDGAAALDATYALAWSALVNLQQGRLIAARAEGNEATRRARALGSGLYTLLALMWSARASVHLGDLAAADASVEQADELVAEGWATLEPFVELLRGEVALAHGELQRAVDLLAPSAPVACLVSPVLGAVALAQLAQALAGVARFDDARHSLDDAASIVGDGHGPWGRACVAAAGAQVALLAGDLAAAYEEALEALKQSAAIDDVVTGAAALELLASSSAGRGQEQRSERLAAMAAAVRSEHGLPGGVPGPPVSLAQAVGFVGRGRGRRLRAAHGWDALTPTEREVVALVAEGLTNPEIAQRLFVARSTVKDHLAKVFRKLGVTTRAELSAVATRNGLTSEPP